jgi:hypothetical protein
MDGVRGEFEIITNDEGVEQRRGVGTESAALAQPDDTLSPRSII